MKIIVAAGRWSGIHLQAFELSELYGTRTPMPRAQAFIGLQVVG